MRAAWESSVDVAWAAGNQAIFNYLISPYNCQATWINATRKRIDWQAAMLSDSKMLATASLKPLEPDIRIWSDLDFYLLPYLRRLRTRREDLSDTYATLLLGRLVKHLYHDDTKYPDDCTYLVEYLIRCNANALITPKELESIQEQAFMAQFCVGLRYHPYIFEPMRHYFGGYDEDVELTVIDIAYCIAPALYLAYNDRRQSLPRKPTLAGAMNALNLGLEFFETYLQVNRFTDIEKQNRFLHNTLVHLAQLSKRWTTEHLRMLLLAGGESMDSLAAKVLHLFVNLVALPPESPERSLIHNRAVTLLLETGCQISPKALLNAIRSGNTDLLSILVSYSDLRKIGPFSLCASVWTDNTDSLNLLRMLGIAVSNVEVGSVTYPSHPGSFRSRHTFFGEELTDARRDDWYCYDVKRDQYPMSLLQAVGKGSEEHLTPVPMIMRCLDLAKNGTTKAPQIYLYDLLLGCLESRAHLSTTSEVCQLVKSEGLEFSDQPLRPSLIEAFLCTLNNFGVATPFESRSTHDTERPGVLEPIFRFLVSNGTPLPKDVISWLLEVHASNDLILFALDCGAYTNTHASRWEWEGILSSIALRDRLPLLRGILERRCVEINPVDLATAFGIVNSSRIQASPLERLETLQFMEQFSPDLKILSNSTIAKLATDNACFGHVDGMIILIRHGLDINAVIHISYGTIGDTRCLTALDSAASAGYLDMVQLLLNSGGMSAVPGETGCDGAIAMAEWCGHHAVAELIHKWVDLGVQLGIEDVARLQDVS
ncbi:uncharacterized protein E0L32_010274 [Thyridium curvatum]|uniref:Uncharacterized protein n=1 Tax=Thyridium curvatum TaxID=1093900 RepID=A0A507ANU3_9PEZI|nr:uncharacterized protein E0L32_010274 [Thyridium curvatum]TPX08074.1 hypothetical protein E0L32_010274 [Thyridium curvatum]